MYTPSEFLGGIFHPFKKFIPVPQISQDLSPSHHFQQSITHQKLIPYGISK